MRGVSMAFATFIACLPLAVAQAPATPVATFTTMDMPTPIVPLAEFGRTELHLAFSCSQQELMGTLGAPIVVSLAPAANPSFATYTVEPKTVTLQSRSADGCTDATLRHFVNGSMMVVLTRSAPAFVAQKATMTAKATHARVTGETDTWGPYSANTSYMAGYFPQFNVRPSTVRLPAPRPDEKVIFPVAIQHTSNGASVLTATAALVGSTPPLVFELPAPVEIAAGIDQPVESQVDIVARVPAAAYGPDRTYAFQTTFHIASKDPRGAGAMEEVVSFVMYTPKGGKAPIPGGEPLVALALATLLVGARRRLT